MTPFAWLALGIAAALATGMVALLYLLILAKRDLNSVQSRLERQIQAVTADLKNRLDVLNQEYLDLAEHSQMLVPPAPVRSGFNLSKRSQVVHMHRKGDPPERIAAALSLPLSEVVLLVKVHDLTSSSARNGVAG